MDSLLDATSYYLTRLFNAIGAHFPDAREIGPGIWQNNTMFKFPEQLRSLYSVTDGYAISAYLPDRFEDEQMTFALIPQHGIFDLYDHLIDSTPEKPEFWNRLPHFIRVKTAGSDADLVWHPEWIPFAEDGFGNFQFVRSNGPKTVYQYDGKTFAIRKIAVSLAEYFSKVASQIEQGILVPFNMRKHHAKPKMMPYLTRI